MMNLSHLVLRKTFIFVGFLGAVACHRKPEQSADLRTQNSSSLQESPDSQFCSMSSSDLKNDQILSLVGSNRSDDQVLVSLSDAQGESGESPVPTAGDIKPCPNILINSIKQSWSTAEAMPTCGAEKSKSIIGRDGQERFKVEVAGMVLYLTSSYCSANSLVKKI